MGGKERKDVEELLEADCEKVENYIEFNEIAAINCLITDPEEFENHFRYTGELRDNYEKLIKLLSSVSPRYSDSHEQDMFNIQERAAIENLLNFELKKLCERNNDVVYLAAKLMHRIASGHPFGEGNKRTAYIAGCSFLWKHQHHFMGLDDRYVLPKLDEDLLESLGDIALDSEALSAEKLASQFREDLERDIRDALLRD